MLVPLLLVACVVLLVLYYHHRLNKRSMEMFDAAGIPYLKPLPILGNMSRLLFRGLTVHELIKEIYDMSPEAKYVGFFEFGTPVLMIRDLDLIKAIAIKNSDNFANHRGFVDSISEPLFGRSLFSLKNDEWKNMRVLISPAFTSSKMKTMFGAMVSVAENFSKVLLRDSEVTLRDAKENRVNVWELFGRYTTDVITNTAFGISTNSVEDTSNDFYRIGKCITFTNPSQAMKLFFLRNFPLVRKLFNLKFVTDDIGRFFVNAMDQIMKKRQQEGVERPDLLQLLMEHNKKSANTISLDDITSQAFIFFLGGFDTTTTTMSFMALQLAVQQEIQDRLRQEVDDLLERTNGRPTYEDINNMEYLDAVFNEILRFYPAAAFLDRVCGSSFELPPVLPGCKPFTLKPGTFLWFPVYAFHKDPKYFEDPDTFDPDRFLDKKNANNSAFLPFGIGPRICIGNRFAILTAKVAFFHILAHCYLEPAKETKVPVTFSRKSIILLPEGGFCLNVRPRSSPCNVSE